MITGLTLHRMSQFIAKHMKGYLIFLQKDYPKAMQVICSNFVGHNGSPNLPEEGESALKDYCSVFKLSNLAACNMQMGNYALAIQLLTKAFQMTDSPSSNKTQFSTSSYHDSISTFTKKEMVWRNDLLLMNLRTKRSQILRMLGLGCLQKEKYTDAINNFKQVSKTFSTDYLYWYRLGLAYYKKYQKYSLENSQKGISDLYLAFEEKTVIQPTEDLSLSQADEGTSNHAFSTSSGGTKSGSGTGNWSASKKKEEGSKLKRFILRASEIPQKTPDSIEDDSELAEENLAIEEHFENLRHAFHAFSNCVSLTQKQILELRSSFSEIKHFSSELSSDFFSTSYSTPLLQNSLNKCDMGEMEAAIEREQDSQKKKMRKFLVSSLQHACFIGLTLKKWLIVSSFCQKAKSLEFLTEEQKFCFANYESEALCRLGRDREAIETLKSLSHSEIPKSQTISSRSFVCGFRDFEVPSKAIWSNNIAACQMAGRETTKAQEALNDCLRLEFDENRGVPSSIVLNLCNLELMKGTIHTLPLNCLFHLICLHFFPFLKRTGRSSFASSYLKNRGSSSRSTSGFLNIAY